MMIQPSFDTNSRIAKFGGDPGPGDGKSWKVGQIIKIGKIINHKGRAVDSLVLEPQGIAHLISEEDVNLPPDICALAHVLTRKCNQGLLTLNIGVVDPGWEGKISTSVLNFSSEKRLLTKGDSFMRLTFHRVQMEPGSEGVRSELSPRILSDSYQRDVSSRAVDCFGKHFLNIQQLVGHASKKENARLRDAMLRYLPIAAFSLAFFALLVTVGGVVATRALSQNRQTPNIPGSSSDAELSRLSAKVVELESLVKSQSARLEPARLDSKAKVEQQSSKH